MAAIHGMAIGEVGRRTGLAASAIRYYEKARLLPKPARIGGQRRYESDILGRIRIVQLALAAGFTVAETRLFVSGFSPDTTPAARWRSLASRKIEEIDALLAHARRMKLLLQSSFRCGCVRLEDCEQLYAGAIAARRIGPKPPASSCVGRRAHRPANAARGFSPSNCARR